MPSVKSPNNDPSDLAASSPGVPFEGRNVCRTNSTSSEKKVQSYRIATSGMMLEECVMVEIALK